MKPRNHRFFDNWARKLGMKPVCRVVAEGGDILVADSGAKLFESERLFYRTGFAIERPGDKKPLWLASTEETDALDPEMCSRSERGAQEYRVNEALAYARKQLAKTVNVGLYDDDGTNRIH